MNRTGLKWWQKAIIANIVVALVVLFSIDIESSGIVWVLIYAAVSVYLLKFVPVKNIEGYDDIA